MRASQFSIVLAVGICQSLIILTIACSDLKESAYPALADAKRDGAIAHGWLPEILPPSTADIREIHNIDTNQVWCMFRFASDDAEGLRQQLALLQRAQVARTYVRAPGVDWWPRELEGKLDPDTIGAAGFALYKHQLWYFAVDWDKNRAFVYDPGK